MTEFNRLGVHPLRVVDGAGEGPLTGAELMRDVARLITAGLPEVAVDDPYRGALAAFACSAPPQRGV
jgi:hypothetical protein